MSEWRAGMPIASDRRSWHRAAEVRGPRSGLVRRYHSHTYFDHTRPESVAAARAFMDRIRETFAASPHVEVHAFLAEAAGPHPCGSFEVRFTGDAFAEYVSWLMFARPPELSTLVHPLTGAQARDHTTRALWLGTALALDQAMLEAVDAQTIPR